MADTKVADRPRSKKGLMVWLLLAVAAGAAGAALPWIIHGRHHAEHSRKHETVKHKSTAIPFGDVVVNLGDKNLNRYLRVKILVAVEEPDVKEVTDLLTQKKAFLKSWLIEHLASLSTADVGRKQGVNKLRREICDEFNVRLFPGGEDKVLEILFDEYVVQ